MVVPMTILAFRPSSLACFTLISPLRRDALKAVVRRQMFRLCAPRCAARIGGAEASRLAHSSRIRRLTDRGAFAAHRVSCQRRKEKPPIKNRPNKKNSCSCTDTRLLSPSRSSQEKPLAEHGSNSAVFQVGVSRRRCVVVVQNSDARSKRKTPRIKTSLFMQAPLPLPP